MRRVVQFSTGNVGQHSLKAIIGRPDLELVGVHAASPNKVGRDAAELCGLTESTGVIATDDIDALIALKPDCVVYTAQAETRPMEAVEQLAKLLAAGINVVGSSMVWLVTPRQADDWLTGPLGKACEEGNLNAAQQLCIQSGGSAGPSLGACTCGASLSVQTLQPQNYQYCVRNDRLGSKIPDWLLNMMGLQQ